MAVAPAPSVAKYRAQLAGLSRDRDRDDPALRNARQNLRAAKLEDYVLKALAAAPPLTNEQLERIAALLRAGGAA